jgi:peptidoglycan/LPS O-acetylase OafA/YrhL
MGLLRFTLAIAVLLSHLPGAGVQFLGGGLAVQAFFIVSGFYMALVLDGKYREPRLFYGNRLLRLAPSYGLLLLASAIALFGFGLSATASVETYTRVAADPITAALLGLQNLFVVGQELLFWARIEADGRLLFDATGALPSATTTVAWQALLLPQAWSLSMELLFYLLAPWLVRLRTRTLCVLALASIGLRFAGVLLPVHYGIWQGRLFPTALFLFVFGMLAYRTLPLARRQPRLGALLLPLLLALVVGLPQLGLDDEAGRWLVYVAVGSTIPWIFLLSRDWAVDRWIGELSYPIYLSHLLVLGVLWPLQLAQTQWSVLLVTLLLSAALLQWVERPVDRWRQRRLQRPAAGHG